MMRKIVCEHVITGNQFIYHIDISNIYYQKCSFKLNQLYTRDRVMLRDYLDYCLTRLNKYSHCRDRDIAYTNINNLKNISYEFWYKYDF